MKTKNIKNIYQAILSLKNEDECKKFIRDLLTSGEIEEFSNRWKAAQMLDQKIPYEKIEESTGMSSTTIARIAKWLNNGMGGYKIVIKRLKNNQKINNHHPQFIAV